MVLYLQFMVVLHLLLVARSMAMYLFWDCFLLNIGKFNSLITFFFVAYHVYGQYANNLVVIVLDRYAFIPLLQIQFIFVYPLQFWYCASERELWCSFVDQCVQHFHLFTGTIKLIGCMV